MRQNMGSVDRIVRFALAVVVGILYLTGNIGGTAALILGIIAIMFLATSLIGWCPLYVPFGLSTRKQP
jgi:hypothetical protein